MNLLAIIFIACVSISTALPSVEDQSGSTVKNEVTYTCQQGYELDGANCRQLMDRIYRCPDGAAGSNIGDKCVVDNKYCSFGHPSTHATVEDRTERECDEGYTFSAAVNRCQKKVDHGIAINHCPLNLTFRGGKCLKFKDKKDVCDKDAALSTPGCMPRSTRREWCGCPQYYRLDPTNRNNCIFDELSPTKGLCTDTYTADTESDRCVHVWRSYDTPRPKFSCTKGEIVEGRCEEVSNKIATVFCPLESDPSLNTNGGRLPLTCFQGTVKETVKGTGETAVSEKRCLVTKNVQTELLCPIGSSPSSINPTKCKSDVTTAADVVTSSTSTATTETTAADVVVDVTDSESSEEDEDVLEGDQSVKAAKDVSTDDAGKANDVSVQNKSQVGENKSQVEEGKSLEDDKSGETGARVETGNVSPVSESLKEEDKPAEKNEDVLEGDVPTTTTAAS